MSRSPRSHCLEVPDVHFGRGPFGKLHVRFGKGAHTSGPRPRWVPMLDGLDLVLRWFLTDVRPRFPDSPVLFADESGGALHRGTIRNRLRYLMQLEGRPATERFSPHALRRACATHNYERGVDLVAIQQLLGHWTVSSTMRYASVGDVHRGRLSPGGHVNARAAERRGRVGMKIRWRLRMAAAQREVWTGTELRRLLAEKAGLEMSAASVSALLTKESPARSSSPRCSRCAPRWSAPPTTSSRSIPHRSNSPLRRLGRRRSRRRRPRTRGAGQCRRCSRCARKRLHSMGKRQRDCAVCGAPVGIIGRELCCRCVRRQGSATPNSPARSAGAIGS
jgi:hypothetical protein